MIKYKYTALKDNKILVEGEIEANDLKEAREKIRILGYIPTKVYNEDNSQTVYKTQNISVKKIKFLSLAQKISFTSQMQTLVSAVSVLEALNSVEKTAPDNKIRELCASIKFLITNNGKTFAQALEYVAGKAFGNVYIALIKTGEASGELDITLDRMLVLLRKQENIKNHVVKSSVYPAFLLSGMFGLLVLFAKFVFPAFASVMAFNGAELPCLAKSLVGTMYFLDKFWWLVIIFIGAACGLFIQLFKTYGIKNAIDTFVLRIPVLSNFVRYLNLSNFMTVLSISYEAGITMPEGLELANKTVANTCINSKIKETINHVKTGMTLTESFQLSKALPDEILSIVSAGEMSGTLGKMFKDVALTIDRKLDLALEALMKMVEPILIVIMGGFVLFIVLAFAQAYTGMLGSLF